jgi:hypothetical protein
LQVEEEVEAETELVGEGEEPSEEGAPAEGAADEGPSGEE